MALDVSDFVVKQPDWGGLYKAADTMEQRMYRQSMLQDRQETRRNQSASFLNNYLDQKDYLSGTAYDPVIIGGLHTAMQHGAYLASQGVDSPTIMMALGPMVNRLNDYSNRAKGVSKQVDDDIKLMQQNGYKGYDYAKIKSYALDNAFYDTDEKGNKSLNPDKADINTHWVQQAIENNTSDVTTSAGLDEFAKTSPMQRIGADTYIRDPFGKTSRTKVHFTGQNWLVPEFDKDKVATGLVPKHDIATEGNNPITHWVQDANGKNIQKNIRLLDEGFYDDISKKRPDVANYINGEVKQHLKEYLASTGEEIPLNSPKAKLVGRAILYEELDRRKAEGIDILSDPNKQSTFRTNLNIRESPEYLQQLSDESAAKAKGYAAGKGLTAAQMMKKFDRNTVESIGDIFNNKADSLHGDEVTYKGRTTIDVTAALPGGGLKKGRGENEVYKQILYDPAKRSLIVSTETKDDLGMKHTETEEKPEKDMEAFLYKIAEANGVNKGYVKTLLDNMGYANGKFKNPAALPSDLAGKIDSESRTNKQRLVGITTFEHSGDTGKIQDNVGKEIKDGGTISKISNYTFNPFGPSKYFILVTDENGNEKEIKFKDKTSLAKYLKENID